MRYLNVTTNAPHLTDHGTIPPEFLSYIRRTYHTKSIDLV